MSGTVMVNGDGVGETFVFESPFDKLRLTGHNWPARGSRTQAVILILHGSGEHCQRYLHMAQFFNDHQIACVSFDWRGHGESEGERGFVPCLDALHDDLECIIQRIQTELHPGVPIVTYSHGTGSVICLSHILRRPSKPLGCEAMIISTPSLCLKNRPTQLLLFLARAFANLDPHFLLPIQGNYTHRYTNDEKVVEAYRNDPLVHDRWPAMTLSVFMELGLLLERNIFDSPCPILIQHGIADIVTPIKGIREWVRKRVIGDVQFKEWPGNFHELHNDLNKEEILTFVVRWIEEKLKI